MIGLVAPKSTESMTTVPRNSIGLDLQVQHPKATYAEGATDWT